jgi:uncharacterized protein with HEPN domain
MSILDLAGRLDDILAAIHEIEAFAAGKTFDDYMAEPMLRRCKSANPAQITGGSTR